jgi:internalin A
MKKLAALFILLLFMAVLTACTEPIDPFTVTLVNGDDVQEFLVQEGIDIEFEEPENGDLIFIGWFLDEDFNIPFEATTMPSEDITLYAKFVENEFVITLQNYGGLGYSSISTMYDTPIPNPTDPTREGYIFLGYYLDEDFQTPMDWDMKMPKYDFTVYARYDEN